MTVVQIWNFFNSIFIPFMKYFWYTVVFSRSNREYIKKLTGCCIISLCVQTVLYKKDSGKPQHPENIFIFNRPVCLPGKQPTPGTADSWRLPGYTGMSVALLF